MSIFLDFSDPQPCWVGAMLSFAAAAVVGL